MAHELDFSKGRPAIAYTGQKPWHGYGELMPDDQTLDEWRVAAGMDFSVLRKQVQFVVSDAAGEAIRRSFVGREVLIRDDTFAPLAVVSNRYKIIQPAEVLAFFDELIKGQGFKMNTAGVLANGKKIWAMAETGKDFTLGGEDRIGAYLLLATSYDAQFATTAQFTTIRVVCNNTLQFSLNRRNGKAGAVRIPHNAEFNAAAVKAQLGLIGADGWEQFKSNITALADLKVSQETAVKFFLTMMGVTEEEAADGKQLFNVKKLIEIYENGPGAKLSTAKGTAWGLVNAVTYFTDHGRRAKNPGTRFDAASFGSGAVLKEKAYVAATALLAA